MDSSVFFECDRVYHDHSGITALRLHHYLLYGDDVDENFRAELISRGYIRKDIRFIFDLYAYCCESCHKVDDRYTPGKHMITDEESYSDEESDSDEFSSVEETYFYNFSTQWTFGLIYYIFNFFIKKK